MSKKSINFKYEHFEKLWSKASDKEKSKLFYFSLFDFGAFEQEARTEIITYTQDIEKKLKELIKNLNKNFFTKIEKDGFIKTVANDKLLRFILFYELKKNKININTRENFFPDLLINNEIELEIKRLTTTRNLQEYLDDLNERKSDKLLLLLFFPRILEEDIVRLKELTDGYYFAKKNIKNPRNVEMLICYPDVDNFKDILEKIIKCINCPAWHKNI